MKRRKYLRKGLTQWDGCRHPGDQEIGKHISMNQL
jgi:hypothetical protein